jgi:predicted Rdx family selenoprotein
VSIPLPVTQILLPIATNGTTLLPGPAPSFAVTCSEHDRCEGVILWNITLGSPENLRYRKLRLRKRIRSAHDLGYGDRSSDRPLRANEEP